MAEYKVLYSSIPAGTINIQNKIIPALINEGWSLKIAISCFGNENSIVTIEYSFFEKEATISEKFKWGGSCEKLKRFEEELNYRVNHFGWKPETCSLHVSEQDGDSVIHAWIFERK